MHQSLERVLFSEQYLLYGSTKDRILRIGYASTSIFKIILIKR